VKIRRLIPLAAVAALASVAAMAVPSGAAASPAKYCSIKNVKGTRTAATKVRIKARNLAKGTYWTAKCKTARKLVEASVYRSPVHTHMVKLGFACNSEKLSSGGLDQRWRCKYRGADNPSFSKIAFNLHLHS